MKKPEKRDEIIRAALEVIAEYGFHGSPMALIAEKAGVGAGTIYLYFESKDVLINEVFKEIEKEIIAVLMENHTVGKDLREKFLHFSTLLLNYFITHPIHFRYVEQYHNSPYGVSLRRERMLSKSEDIDIFREIFEEGIAQQVLKDFSLPVLYALAFGPLITLIRDHILGIIVLDNSLIRQTMAACWDGIKR